MPSMQLRIHLSSLRSFYDKYADAFDDGQPLQGFIDITYEPAYNGYSDFSKEAFDERLRDELPRDVLPRKTHESFANWIINKTY